MFLFSLWTISLVFIADSASSSSRFGFDQKDAERWADAAVNFVRNFTCEEAFLTTEGDCNQLQSVPTNQMNLYLAAPTPQGRLLAVLPDGPLNRVGTHDAVLVLDPYPIANLGHLLVVFFVDVGWSELQCELNGGQFLGNNECLSLALRKRCHNLLMEAKWKLKYLNKQSRNKHCEINFFPLVHVAGETPNQLEQRLTCLDDIEGFAPCPTLRSHNQTDTLLCDPLQLNTQRCSTTHATVGTRCRLFERCDHAVLLSGGWDRITSKPQHKDNLLEMHTMLKDNGFPEENIKIFYANGDNIVEDGAEEEVLRLYPSAFKATMRYHLHKLCKSPNCVDSLVLYLNSPTKNDGTSLLWDVDGNGQADENEMYTVRELLYDIQDCTAQQVYIIADQGYSGKIIHALEHSNRHHNVLAFASGQEHEFSWSGEYTKLWTAAHQVNVCASEAHKTAQLTMSSSQPLDYDGSKGTIQTTLFGAPCNVRLPFTEQELKRSYYGCQNLPTRVWLQWRTRNMEDIE